MIEKVHHVISAGLVKGRYYKVYVTQVNQQGNESPRSDPSLIRVGDVYPPANPVLSLDTSEFSNGCYCDDGKINIMFRWNEAYCDDLDKFIYYTWRKRPEGFENDGVYPKELGSSADSQGFLPSGATSATLGGQPNGEYVYVGLQAVDLSRNYSDICIIKVLAEDTSVLLKPTAPIKVTPHGIWSLEVSTDCPKLSNIKYVVFYRDGWKQLTPVIFHKGLTATIVDTLDVIDGLDHFYTYLYVTLDGRQSPMSDPSITVTAKPIDTTYIDSVALDALKKAWNSDNVSNISALKAAADEDRKQVEDLANKLSTATENYNKMFDKFTLAAKQIELLSAEVDKQKEVQSDLQTSIRQNAKDITLRATKTDIDNATNQLQKSTVAMINVQADRINQVVANTSGYSSQITQLADQLQSKVSQGDLAAQFNLACQNGISVAYIKANRIVLDGEMLLQGNARVCGRFYSNDIALVNSQTNQVIWGAGSGTIKPTVTDLGTGNEGYRELFHDSNWGNWGGGYLSLGSYNYIARPPVNFNGMSSVKIETWVRVVITAPNWTYGRSGHFYLAVQDSSHRTQDSQKFEISYDGWYGYGDHQWAKVCHCVYETNLRIGEQVQIDTSLWAGTCEWYGENGTDHGWVNDSGQYCQAIAMQGFKIHIEAI